MQDYYKYTRTSSVRQKWLNQYLVNLSYYRGNQWLEPELLKEMSDIGATPYTYNNIEPLVDAYVSLQIRSVFFFTQVHVKFNWRSWLVVF